MRIEPTLLAWKARVLPLNYARKKKWARSQPIRTAAQIQDKIIITRLKAHFLYQKISAKAKELSLLGMDQTQIAKALSVSRRTIQLALSFIQDKSYPNKQTA